MTDLNPYIKKRPTRRLPPADENDRHTAMINAVSEYAKATVKNQDIVLIDKSNNTKKTKVMLILMPEWAVMFPPFNLARLSSISSAAGFETRCLDLNIKAYNYLFNKYDLASLWKHNQNPEAAKYLDFNPWDGAREWKWTGNNYFSELHGLLTPFFETFIDNIVEYAPDVIGFSVYYCNSVPTNLFATELKKRLPNTLFMMGGSDAHKQLQSYDPVWDYIVRGEGEQIYLEILEEIEKGHRPQELDIRSQPVDQRINISSFPVARYDDFNFNEYVIPNGITTEFSRGCTAKCTFCEETHFWKFRQRLAVDALTEIKKLYYEKGINVIWFIDSLVNGNLHELRAFCKGVVAAGMDLHWTGYGRCDGKMDLEYYKDLAASGCISFNYGIESGSQAVLNAMDKGVSIAEMEDNFESGAITGVQAFTNWIMGFPEEEYEDAANTLTFLWRIRNKNIANISPGFGFGLGMNTVVGQNPRRWGLLDHKYLGGIMTHDFRLSKFHILVRMKSFYIFCRNLVLEKQFSLPFRPNIDDHHYNIEYNNPNIHKDVEYEKFDYNIIKPGISPFADSLVNEVWVILRMLWRVRGGYKLTLLFDEELDMIEYGDRNAGPYWAKHVFEITDDGKWTADFTYKFKQPEKKITEGPGEKIPFFAQDYSRETVNPSIRARKIAKPTEWNFEGRTHEEFMDLVNEEKWLNHNIDFSFEYEWKGEGDWSGPIEVVDPSTFKEEKFISTRRKRSEILDQRKKV